MTTDIFTKYKNVGFIPFSFKLGCKSNGKKDISEIPSHSKINKFSSSNIDKRKNGHAIRTGTKIKDKYLIAVDIDDKPEEDIYNGLPKWKELLNTHYNIKQKTIKINVDENLKLDEISTETGITFLKTPTQKTGNNGYHYLFLVDEEQFNIIGSGLIGLTINNSFKKYSIDVKALNGFIISEPSKYSNKFYKWIVAPDTDILNIPSWLFEIIRQNKQPTKKILKPIDEIKQKTIKHEITPPTDDIIYKYIDCINDNRYNNYNEWIKILLIFKNNNLSFNYFLEKSRKSKFYETDDYIINKWDSFKHNNGYSLKTLYSIAKNDNTAQFNKIYSEDKRQKNINKLFDTTNYNFVDIDKKFIIDGTDSDNIIFNNINKWITDDNIKSLNIKSQYGSGKTQLIKSILDKYKPERVLWVSYRQTLTDNIEYEFKEYNFKSYLNKDYNGDRQIIQLESLPILRQFNFLDESEEEGAGIFEIPAYDIIIIDEIESILNHFSASTFKHGTSKDIYNYLYDIITTSKKLLTLDGDINERALSYISNFGNMLNINNKYNTNTRHFNIIQDEPLFLKKLYDDIATAKKDNKKIGICSMSKTETIKYTKLINDNFNNEMKILTINADSNDSDKKLLKDIQTEILKYDVFIYSPTVEAGVNINNKGIFNKLYCIICGCSTSPRAFLQMTARIRNLNDTTINILNTSLYLNDKCNFWEYEDAKELLKMNNEIILERTTIKKDDKILEVNKISPFMSTLIFNKVEALNNNPYYFLKLLGVICERKGIKLTYDETPPENIKMTIDKLNYLENIINVKYPNTHEREQIQIKINNRTANTTEKLQMTNYFYCKLFNVSKLDTNILKDYHKQEHEIKNFIYLLDAKHIKDTNNNKYIQLEIINKLIKQLGYKNIYDTREIKEDELNDNLKNIIEDRNNKFNCLDKPARIAFNMPKFDTNIKIIEEIIKDGHKKVKRPLMFHINTLLERYLLHISVVQRRTCTDPKANKTNFYILKRLKNIDEIIFYKKMKIDIIDNDNNINFDEYEFKYSHLRALKEVENKNLDEFIDDEDIIEHIETLKKDITN